MRRAGLQLLLAVLIGWIAGCGGPTGASMHSGLDKPAPKTAPPPKSATP